MDDLRARRLSELAWPATRAYYVHRLRYRVSALIRQAERFAVGLALPGYDAAQGERAIWYEVFGIQILMRLSTDIPRAHDTFFQGCSKAEDWLDRLLSGLEMTDPRDPPRDSEQHARRLSDPDHLQAFRQILDLIPDPFEGKHGKAIALFEWARHHLEAEPDAWDFHATIPTDFDRRWACASVDRDKFGRYKHVSEAVVRERRRGLLIEAGLLRTDSTIGPPTASNAPAGKAPAAETLTLDDRAVATLTRWLKEGRSDISKRAIARAMGCHHSSLKSCPTFLGLWKANMDRPSRGYRDAKTGRLETADDD